jgi:hypothetical protein
MDGYSEIIKLGAGKNAYALLHLTEPISSNENLTPVNCEIEIKRFVGREAGRQGKETSK